METFLMGLVEAFKGDLFEIGVLVILLAIFALAAMVWHSISRTERFRQFSTFLPILDTAIESLIRQIADNDTVVDWEAARAVELGIDPRMLYVLERIEILLDRNGFNIEMEDLYLRAQNIYRDMVEKGTID